LADGVKGFSDILSAGAIVTPVPEGWRTNGDVASLEVTVTESDKPVRREALLYARSGDRWLLLGSAPIEGTP
jgi:hypothetical protein